MSSLQRFRHKITSGVRFQAAIAVMCFALLQCLGVMNASVMPSAIAAESHHSSHSAEPETHVPDAHQSDDHHVQHTHITNAQSHHQVAHHHSSVDASMQIHDGHGDHSCADMASDEDVSAHCSDKEMDCCAVIINSHVDTSVKSAGEGISWLVTTFSTLIKILPDVTEVTSVRYVDTVRSLYQVLPVWLTSCSMLN